MKKWKSLLSNAPKKVLVIYLILRLLVIAAMIEQIINRNFENVFICILTLFLFTVPSLLERRLHIILPDTLEIIILIFIFAAEILGEIREYYLIFPIWDTLLHTTNGFLFAAIGFSLVHLLNREDRVPVKLSPFYMAVTAFCFSMTIGVLWEFFEWGMDTIFRTDMQKDTVIMALSTVNLDPGGHNVAYQVRNITDTILVFADGTSRSMGLGGYLDIGLIDTMKDLLVNFIGATVFSIIGYVYVKTGEKGVFAKKFIPQVLEEDEHADHEQKDLPGDESSH
ncbi:MAG: hypothetical protein PUF71_04660 [Firmicutes bacterium]|nr:hypothetical protein [Bacillota bacterium]